MKIQKGFSLLIILISAASIVGLLVFLYPRLQIQNPEISDSKYKIAYKIGGDYVDGGDLWIMSPDGTNKNKLIQTGDIGTVYGWSPDNKYIAVSLVNTEIKGDNRYFVQSIGVVDARSGEVLRLKENIIGSIFSLSWYDNQSLLYVKSATIADKVGSVEKISIFDKKTEQLLVFPRDIPEIPANFDLSVKLAFSPDREWIAFDKRVCCEKPPFPENVYVYNLKTKVKKQLTSTGNAWFDSWKDNKVVFSTPDQNGRIYWEINPDGSGMRRIDKEAPSKLAPENQYGNSSDYVSLSPDKEFVVYIRRYEAPKDRATGPIVCFTKFLKEQRIVQTTKEPCFFPVISN